MMVQLTPLNLNRFARDQRTFLGRTLGAGLQTGKLTSVLTEALGDYLRRTAMNDARRFRRGLRIGREDLERHVHRIVTSLSLALEEASGGDLNRGVSRLAEGDFESLRKRGYERFFKCLSEIQRTACALLDAPEGWFLAEFEQDLRRWTSIVPEEGITRTEEGACHPMALETEYPRFKRMQYGAIFLKSMPGPLLRDLLEHVPWGEGRPARKGGLPPRREEFSQVLRNTIVALALDLERLVLTDRDIRTFLSVCCGKDGLRPEVGEKVRTLLRRHLSEESDDPAYCQAILEALEEELETIEHLLPEVLPHSVGQHLFLTRETEG